MEEINRFATTFYKDVAKIYDSITRLRNTERNPTGFSLHDAPILGLLVRIWKLLKEIIRNIDESRLAGDILDVLDDLFFRPVWWLGSHGRVTA